MVACHGVSCPRVDSHRATYLNTRSVSRFTGSPSPESSERRGGESVRDEGDTERRQLDIDDREAHPIDRHRSL